MARCVTSIFDETIILIEELSTCLNLNNQVAFKNPSLSIYRVTLWGVIIYRETSPSKEKHPTRAKTRLWDSNGF